MTDELREKIDSFEKKRQGFLDEMEKLEAERLEARPDADRWSIIEIIEHMVIAEKEVLMGMPKFSDLAGKKRSLKNRIMYPIVIFVLNSRIRVKVPSKTMNPSGGKSLAELREKWDESQQWFREYVDGLDEEGLNKAVFFHPVSGPINVEQAIEMSHAHLGTHARQVRGILESEG